MCCSSCSNFLSSAQCSAVFRTNKENARRVDTLIGHPGQAETSNKNHDSFVLEPCSVCRRARSQLSLLFGNLVGHSDESDVCISMLSLFTFPVINAMVTLYFVRPYMNYTTRLCGRVLRKNHMVVASVQPISNQFS